MILTDLNLITAYRMHTPKWAISPNSGAGAALCGGRLNRPGIEALYLSLDEQTAINEFKGTSSLLSPGTLVSYEISAPNIVDFTRGYQSDKWPPLWESFYCDWRNLAFDEKIEPPSWVLGDQVLAAGAKGVLFRSAYGFDGVNLVLYPSVADESVRIITNDPNNDLPKNQLSWLLKTLPRQ